MKQLILIFLLTSTFTSPNLSNDEILLRTISKLGTLNSIEYVHLFQKVDKNRNSTNLDTAICFFDFSSADNLIGTKYHFQSKYGEEVFDGKTEFTFNTEQRRILIADTPTKDHLSSSFWIQNSILSLRELLPKMINDPSITLVQQEDEIINSQSYYKYIIRLKNRNIQSGLNVIEQNGTTFEQVLIINKETYLPYSYRTIYPKNQGYKMVTFRDINTRASRPDSIWTYGRYPQDILIQSYEEFYSSQKSKTLTKIGDKAPTWKLPMIDGDSISLSNQLGNLVLIEFWFPYCKGCVEAVPDMNKIQEKYKMKGLKVYGIETLNSDYEKLSNYIKKYNIEYPNLYNGKLVSKEYEARVAPTFIILDRSGRYIYIKEGFNKKELIKTIEETL